MTATDQQERSRRGVTAHAEGLAKRQPLVTPPFALAWLVNFCQYLAFYILVTTMALYAVKQFAASDAASGLASSAFVVGATVARVFAGYLVDTFGQRRTLVVSLLVVVLACGFYLPAGSLPLLIAVRMLHGIGYAFASTATMALAQSAIPPERRAEGTGYFALGSTLATAIGPAVGLMIVNDFDYGVLFWTSLGTAIVGLLFGVLLHRYTRQPIPDAAPAPAASAKQGFSLRNIAHPAVVPIGTFMLIVGLCYAGVITYLNAYSQERGLVVGASMFFLAYAAAMFVMRFVLGKLQDRRGDNVVVYLGLVSFAIALAVLAFATQDWQVVLAGALTGLGYGTLMPASQAIAVRLVPSHQLGTGISTLLLLVDAGVGLGPVFLGFLVSSWGYGSMFALLAILVVAAALFYHLAHGRKEVARVVGVS
ncbi:MAG: MFS transporter [Propioniciclava sp.]|uniref:MFS transporter n=1 Tax=Propioniciclava sp. TaxID=2038686 RepID=UPI0039E276FC